MSGFHRLPLALALGAACLAAAQNPSPPTVRLVMRGTGEPATGVAVAVLSIDSKGSVTSKVEAASDPNGVVTVTDTSEGKRYLLIVDDFLRPTSDCEFRLPARVPGTPFVVQVALGGKVTGLVRSPDGKPLAKADVVLEEHEKIEPAAGTQLPKGTVMSSSQRLLTVHTNEKGEFTIPAVAPDDHARVTVTHPDMASATSPEFQIAASKVTRVPDVTLPLRSKVVVRITDASAKPLAGVLVRLLSTDGLRAAALSASGRSNEMGVVQLRISPGTYRLLVEGADPATSEEITVRENDSLERTAVIAPKATIQGVVVDEAGAPIAGAHVASLRGTVGTLHETDAQGRFSIPTVGDAAILVNVHADGFVDVERRELALSKTPHRIVLKRAK
ncbi:MAG: carboxypeptidase regulatory-like domain-containing protein [Planctomycetes bacterium]|nr:carboxypeptidase regulatory-like domain-containing protein [Planctomycetota bacterium]MBI3847227.1 carboxypeptidase regulatory-like domain-containing protein [Planctomycetota bacterium]